MSRWARELGWCLLRWLILAVVWLGLSAVVLVLVIVASVAAAFVLNP